MNGPPSDVLAGRVALVAGGAGAVGEEIVAALLAAGAAVVVPSRSPGRLAEQAARLGEPARLLGVVADVGDDAGTANVAAAIEREHGRLDIVVAAVGGWWQGGPLETIDTPTWERELRTRLTVHHVAARRFLPLVRAQKPPGVYAFVVGDTDVAPVPNASIATVAAAGVMGLSRAAAVECADDPVRVVALHLGPMITRNRRDGPADWYTAREVGERLVALAADPAAPGGVIELRSRLAGDPAPADRGR